MQTTSLKLWLGVDNEIFLVERSFSVHLHEKYLDVIWFLNFIPVAVKRPVLCSNIFMFDGDKWLQTCLCILSTILHTKFHSYLSAEAVFALEKNRISSSDFWKHFHTGKYVCLSYGRRFNQKLDLSGWASVSVYLPTILITDSDVMLPPVTNWDDPCSSRKCIET